MRAARGLAAVVSGTMGPMDTPETVPAHSGQSGSVR
jgi:hypothetical protein